MRPTIPGLRAWAPTTPASEATNLTRAAGDVEAAADQLVREIDALASTWTGGGADAARERAAAERRRLLELADAWSAASRALTVGCNALTTLRRRTLDIVAEAEADHLIVHAGGFVSARPAWLDLLEWLRRIRAAREYQTAIGDLLGQIDTVDRDMASAVATSAGGAADPSTMLAGAPPMGEGPAQPGGEAFVIGPPTKPDIEWDEDFEYGSADPTFDDYAAAAEWKAKMTGARLLRRDLDDALDAYAHYWDNNGKPHKIDYAEAYEEDESVRANIEAEIARAAAGADRLIAAGHRTFSMTGDAASAPHYPVTENWQKTIGGYQQWSSGDVTVVGTTATMTVTVHAEDYYNFNRGQQDIASKAPDDANGRFTEVGWAKPFPTSGEVTRTITWQVGSPESATVVVTENPGR